MGPKRVLVGVALGFGLVATACGGSAEEPIGVTAEQSEAEPAAVEEEAPDSTGPDEAPAPPDGPPGLAQWVSDVQGDPSSVINRGEVLFFPADQVEPLLAGAGMVDVDLEYGLPYAGFLVDQELLLSVGGTVELLGPDGTFATPPSGSLLVCLANVLPGQEPGVPYQVRGCSLVDGWDGTLHISVGEGGVEVG